MSGSLNRAMLIGHLGSKPEGRNGQGGGRIVTFSLATSERWIDEASGERRERTEWHRIVIFNLKLGELAEKYLDKGSKVFVEGIIRTRKWQDKDGADRYSTEIQLPSFNGTLTFLDRKPDGEAEPQAEDDAAAQPAEAEPETAKRRGKKAKA